MSNGTVQNSYKWEKDSIPAIKTNMYITINRKSSFVAGLSAINHNEQAQTVSLYSIGRSGKHATGMGVSQIKGQLQFLTLDESVVIKLIKIAKSDFDGTPTLSELNKYGGFDIKLHYTNPLTSKTYVKTYGGVMLDEVASASGIDILKTEEAISFTAQSVSDYIEQS